MVPSGNHTTPSPKKNHTTPHVRIRFGGIAISKFSIRRCLRISLLPCSTTLWVLPPELFVRYY
jgi:hypothetical protein